MTDQDEVVEVEARSASETGVFLKEWGQESVKRNLPFVNETLRMLVGLNTTLLGGGIVFLKDDVAGWGFRVTALLCFLTSLVIAIYGVWPLESSASFFHPDQILRHKVWALGVKRCRLRWTMFFMVLGFVIALAGVLWRRVFP